VGNLRTVLIAANQWNGEEIALSRGEIVKMAEKKERLRMEQVSKEIMEKVKS